MSEINELGKVTPNPLHIDVIKEGSSNRISYRIWCTVCNAPGLYVPTLDWQKIKCARCMTTLAQVERETMVAGKPIWTGPSPGWGGN